MAHPYWSTVFQLADTDDARGLAEALERETPLSRVRAADGTSLVLHCLYRKRERCLELLARRASEYTLHEAAATGQVGLCQERLRSAPWAIDTLSPDGWTALHLAGFFGRAPVVAALLDAGADPHIWARSFARNLPLHAACAAGRRATEAISLLARATADVNIKQDGGFSPLMECAGNGNLQSLEELLSLGAEATARNDKGETAYDLAVAAGHADCAARLETK